MPATESTSSIVSQQRTGARWLVLLLIGLMYMITYMDRTGISIAAPELAKEFRLTPTMLGLTFSIFLWAYAVGQIPLGWFADSAGPRVVLLMVVPAWSVLTALTAAATGAASLLGVRFAFGLAEAGAFPTATRAMQFWFPKSERGIVHGVCHSFSRLAIAFVPILATAIMLAFGWRWIFYIFGACGLAWSLAFFLLYRNLPENHPKVNTAELSYIRGRNGDGSIRAFAKVNRRIGTPWRKILGSRNMWFLAAGYGCFHYGTYFYITWFPSYLLEYRHLSVKSVGIFASLPLLFAMGGDILGGTLTDLIYKRTGRLRFARRIVAGPAMLASAACMIPAGITRSAPLCIVSLTASLFFLELVIGPAWAVPMDVGGEYSGTVTGAMNMAGAVAASALPIIFGMLIQKGHWIIPFFISAFVLLAGAIIWSFLIDPEKSVVGEPPSASEALA